MKKPLFNKVCIVGVGLIGGSMGLAIKRLGLAREVVGITKTKKSSALAVKMRAIDRTAPLSEAIRDADLVILAAPVLTIIENLKEISKKSHLLKGPVIDVGSSKLEILEAAKPLVKKGLFVGCHPMAGSEKRGVENAEAGLFKGSVCYVTSDSNSKINNLWKTLGVKKIIKVAPDTHDAFVSSVSHLTHILSFSLMHSLTSGKINIAKQGVNPSFRSFVRLAKSDPQIWADIILSNHMEVALELNKVKKAIEQFEKASADRAHLVRWLSAANKKAKTLAPDER